jgi:hypothetical protein
MYNVILCRLRVTIIAVDKQYVLHILSVCVQSIVIQYAMRIRRVILLSMACPAVQYFCTFSNRRYDFRKKILNLEFVLIFSTILFETFFILMAI